ncbi:CDP-glycerol glycerophosphotransferase family protein [Raoultibacter phocaeensis]|uniref:CDP-glycerol glycerophosphotransferase family protein n=1 Tax=Raoultibacter phocaeensis TaxID=2479841 RepID=UPI001117E679|nr:CDP-glycerol glycerophosphotransferase family protein [Raoultibacter phocaeensis]
MKAKRVFVSLSKVIFNILYALFDRFSRKNEVLFVSRQADEPNDDFVAIGEEFLACGWIPVYHTKKLSRKTVISYAIHVAVEIYHLARCKVCILDRYDPVVSLLDFSCERVERVEPMHHYEYPKAPVVIQIWHAFGSYKCFGYQSLDTLEGHSSKTAKLFDIHRNYSWILCTGERDRAVYAEAFAYPVERVIPLCRPEYDALIEKAKSFRRDKRKSTPTVLFAPTLRKSSASEHPFYDLHDSPKLFRLPGRLVWSFHPLEQGKCAPGSVPEVLGEADIVVTDYSSIVYEAYVLGKKVVFYVPDIDVYRESPGLNRDPLVESPRITCTSEEELIGFLTDLISGSLEYSYDAFSSFIGDTFAQCRPGAAKRIAAFAIDKYEKTTLD